MTTGAWAAGGAHERLSQVRRWSELPDLPAEQARDLAEEILSVIDDSGHGLPVLLHGEERSASPGALLARELGLDTRIGLEDTLTLPDGTDAASNTELVMHCRTLLGL